MDFGRQHRIGNALARCGLRAVVVELQVRDMRKQCDWVMQRCDTPLAELDLVGFGSACQYRPPRRDNSNALRMAKLSKTSLG